MTIFKDKIFNVKQFSDRGYNSAVLRPYFTLTATHHYRPKIVRRSIL